MNKELIKQALSNLQNLTVRNDIPLKKDKFYNCWGFTANYLGWNTRLYWVNRETMEKLLLLNSKPVRKIKPGDIAVFRMYGGLLGHTAIVSKLGDEHFKNQIIHKPASNELEVTTELDCMVNWHFFGKVTQYRRPIRQK